MKIPPSKLSQLAAAALLLFPNDAAAFFPTNLLTVGGFVGRSHTQISRDALTALYTELFGIPADQVPKAMTVARDNIAAANADVDDDQTAGEKHFDGESFPEGQYRLITLKKMAVYLMNTGDVNGARTSLGQAMHTLQDFYSHSNYAELKMKKGPVAPLPELGMEGKFIPRLADNVDTCSDCGGGSFSLIKSIFSIIKITDCPNEKCANNLITDKLTSGYYSGENRVKPSGSKKCSHGGPFDGSSGSSITSRGQGINKDSATCTMSPHYQLHYVAASLAQAGTRLFIRDMLKKLNDEQIKSLFGADGNARVTRAADIVQDPTSVNGTALTSPSGPAPATATVNIKKRSADHWAFDGVANAPNGGRMYINAMDPEQHINEDHVTHLAHMAAHQNMKVNAIVPAGSKSAGAYNTVAQRSGGHVFEMHDDDDMGSMQHFGNAAGAPETVDIMMVRDEFTASKKAVTYQVPVDANMGNVTFVASGATTLTVISPDGQKHCSSGGSAYSDQAMVVSMKTNKMVNINSPRAGSYKVTVQGSSQGSFTLTATGTSYLDLADFSFVQVGGRPGHTGYYPVKGAPYTSPDTSSRDHHTVCSALMSGSYKSASFSFRAPSGQILHENVPLIPGSGKEGEQPANDFMTGFPASDVLSTIPKDMMEELTTSNVTLPDNGNLNAMTMPNIGQPFVVYVTGVDVSGNKYQRVVPKTYTPATLLLTPLETPSDIYHDRETTYTFKITNSGSSDTVDVSAVDNHGLSSSVNPPSFKLAKGESKTVTVVVAPHADTIQGTNTLVVAATKREGGCKNYVVVNSPIRPGNPEYEDETYWDDNTIEVDEQPKGYATSSVAAAPTGSAASAIVPIDTNKTPYSDKLVVHLNSSTTAPCANSTAAPTAIPYQGSASKAASLSAVAGFVLMGFFALL